jgi:hypothetical protein
MSLKTLPLTIPAGHTMSSGVDCSGSTRILRIVMPPDWTAAPLTFQVSIDGVTYNNLHLSADVGDFTTYPATIPVVVPGTVVTMPPSSGYGIAWLRFRSGTFTTQIKQDVDRTFQIILDMPDAGTGAGSAGPTGPAGPAGVAGPVGPAGVPGTVTSGPLLQVVVLGHAKGVDFNVLGDTAIAMNSARYVVYQLLSFNNVGGQDNYNGSLRDAAGGLGNDLGFYVYNQDGQAGYWIGAVGGVAPILTAATLYFHIGTKENAPATGDLYVMGYDLTGL